MRPFDASDLLNPVLLKELRQGLKSRTFGVLFLLMTGALCIGAAVCVLGSNFGEDAEELSVVFWLCAGAPLVLLALPSFVLIRSEFKRNTFELMLVTALTPWRILLGKWTSIALQALLVATLILPFVILRYFLGGVELVEDLRFLSAILGVTLLLASVGLTVTSGFKTGLDRVLRVGCIGIVALPFLACFAGMLVSLLVWLLTANSVAAVNGALLSLCVLNRGARELSPEAEQSELLQGRGAFWFMAAAVICSQCAVHWPLAYLALLPLVYLAVMLYLELAAPVPLFVTAALPAAWRHLGREAIAVGFVALQVAWMLGHPLPAPRPLVFVALLGTILLPWALMELLDRWIGDSRTSFYMALQLIITGVAVADFPTELYGFLPTAAFALCLHGTPDPGWMWPVSAVTAASALVLVYRLRKRAQPAQNGDDAFA